MVGLDFSLLVFGIDTDFHNKMIEEEDRRDSFHKNYGLFLNFFWVTFCNKTKFSIRKKKGKKLVSHTKEGLKNENGWN